MSLPNDESIINSLFDGLKLRINICNSSFHLKSKVHKFYLWNQESPWKKVQGKPTDEDVQEYTASDGDGLKRRRKGLAETTDAIVDWMDEQALTLSTHAPSFGMTISTTYKTQYGSKGSSPVGQ
ncbi:hypothetical protein BDQ94DRAFT_176048 [Aspergillus welwitschiae]|uniref:Uncharacterized protein n=1 Tax=Aspergillus welwitschiae TaxID=1341132 RepID=A0A3F3PJJ1_9EURO|nr:hypothetical protein BDQ94DRAFT_176048 [Aspergillus welwitschiae]RDH26953.1 hypothetical protein BDQ94DRAFT_176048 [Aspergillus welwitschiae]